MFSSGSCTFNPFSCCISSSPPSPVIQSIPIPPSPSLLIEEYEPDKANLAHLLSAHYLGTRREKEVVYPSQIEPFLKEHLLTPPQFISGLSLELCRKINDLTCGPLANRGRSLDFKFNASTSSEKYACDGWVQLANDGNSAQAIISHAKLGSGRVKKFSSGQVVNIPLYFNTKSALRDCSCEPQGIITIATQENNIEYTLEKLQEHRRDVEFELYLQKKIKEKLISANLSLETFDLEYTPKPPGLSSNSFGYRKPWKSTDLEKATTYGFLKGFVPKNNAEIVDLSDFLRAFQDITTAVCELHLCHIIHLDIKLANMLGQFFTDSQGKRHFKGSLTDFGLSKLTPCKQKNLSYFYWDSLTSKGYVSPFVDVYGLVIAFVELITHSQLLKAFSGKNQFRLLIDPEKGSSYIYKILSEYIEILIKSYSSIIDWHPELKDSFDIMIRIVENQKANFSAQNPSRPQDIHLISKEIETYLSIDPVVRPHLNLFKKFVGKIYVAESAFDLLLDVLKEDKAIDDYFSTNIDKLNLWRQSWNPSNGKEIFDLINHLSPSMEITVIKKRIDDIINRFLNIDSIELLMPDSDPDLHS